MHRRVCCDMLIRGGGRWGGGVVSHHQLDLNLPARGEGLLKDAQTEEPQTSGCRWLSHSMLTLPGEAPAAMGGVGREAGEAESTPQEAKKVGSSTPRQWASTSSLAAPESL